MESTPSTPPVISKKFWKIIRVVFLMLRKRISKSKLLLDLHHLMSKRGKFLEKVIGNLMFHPHSTFGCRSNDAHLSFIAPNDYEFSCSNSPAFPVHVTHKRSKKHHQNDDATTVIAVQKIMEMLNNELTESSPVLPGFGFGFGRSPMVRQLRITDSPYPLKDVDENSEVDKEAEDFIQKFYQQLRLQKNMSTRSAQSPNVWAPDSS